MGQGLKGSLENFLSKWYTCFYNWYLSISIKYCTLSFFLIKLWYEIDLKIKQFTSDWHTVFVGPVNMLSSGYFTHKLCSRPDRLANTGILALSSHGHKLPDMLSYICLRMPSVIHKAGRRTWARFGYLLKWMVEIYGILHKNDAWTNIVLLFIWLWTTSVDLLLSLYAFSPLV